MIVFPNFKIINGSLLFKILEVFNSKKVCNSLSGFIDNMSIFTFQNYFVKHFKYLKRGSSGYKIRLRERRLEVKIQNKKNEKQQTNGNYGEF